MNDFSTITLITEDELNLNELLKQITLSSDGAVAIFTGLVRGFTSRENPHETDYLEYEAYQPMAEAMMKQVADEIRARWNTIEGIAIIQRVGRLYPCTPTVFIACVIRAFLRRRVMALTVSNKLSLFGRRKLDLIVRSGLKGSISLQLWKISITCCPST